MTNETRSALSIVADGQKKQKEKPSIDEIYEAAKTEPGYATRHISSLSLGYSFDSESHELIISDEDGDEMARFGIDDMFTEYMEEKEKENQKMIHELFMGLVNKHPDFNDVLTRYYMNDYVYFAEIRSPHGGYSVYILANEDELRKLRSFAETMEPLFLSLNLRLLHDIDRIQYIYPSLYKKGDYQNPIAYGWREPYFHQYITWSRLGQVDIEEIEMLDDLMTILEEHPERREKRDVLSYAEFKESFGTEIIYMEHVIEHMSLWDKLSAGKSYKIMKRYIKAFHENL